MTDPFFTRRKFLRTVILGGAIAPTVPSFVNRTFAALDGVAAPLFLFGGALKGGLIGKHPSLTKLERGDLVHHTDFRSVYATLLEQWLKTPSAPVLGRDFGRLALLRS